MRDSAIVIDPSHVDGLRDSVRRFIAGDADLSGLDLYYALEAATPLREFHTHLRTGPQNRMRSGLQQSYGDHNRVLVHALDRLLAGDVDWFRSRVADGARVDDDRLAACVAAARALDLDRATCVTLWLAAALHDCGMLSGLPSGIDVEDGVAIAGRVLEVLCPIELQPLARFAIRNHDYVKDLFAGEVPAPFIAAQLEQLDETLRPVALAALGLIQVAGAASLGEGRLSTFRLSICERCFDGSALAECSPAARLGRLLADDRESTAAPEPVEPDSHVVSLLDRVPLHSWHRAWAAVPGPEATPKHAVLARLADRYSRGTPFDHVVFEAWDGAGEIDTLRNGTRALVVR